MLEAYHYVHGPADTGSNTGGRWIKNAMMMQREDNGVKPSQKCGHPMAD